MSQRKTLVADNLHLLRQGIELVQGLDDALYARREPRVFSFGVGSHLRHCIDFYELFLQALDGGRLDYDRRARDERVEKEREYAIAGLERLARELEGLAEREGELPLLVKADSVGKEAGEAPWSHSSADRELQFLLSHTVHHYALIAVVLRLNGVETAADFGVAPSTLRHWEAQRECAR